MYKYFGVKHYTLSYTFTKKPNRFFVEQNSSRVLELLRVLGHRVLFRVLCDGFPFSIVGDRVLFRVFTDIFLVRFLSDRIFFRFLSDRVFPSSRKTVSFVLMKAL